jgi:glycosyltransferase involved in cell wall biosynthesis
MKKIIIINNNLKTGGVQKSLVNLLNEIKDKYNITLFLFSDEGQYNNLIPKEINVVYASSYVKLLGISQEESKEMGLWYYIIRAICAIYSKYINHILPIRVLTYLHTNQGNYDSAISFLHAATPNSLYGGTNEFVLNRVKAKQKIGFIHCDFLEYGGNTSYARKLYTKFDKVAVVSKGCLNKFIRAIPSIKSKCFVVENCHEFCEIESLGNVNTVQYSKEYINIITVSRLSEEKGIERAIKAISTCIKSGNNIKYHIIGDGPEWANLNYLVKELKITENVLFYGNQINPYRFIKNCDLFLLPSYHEAAPLVFDEAKSLGVPVLATKTTSTKEMVVDSKAGWECDNSIEGIEHSLMHIIKNREKIIDVKNYLLSEQFNNNRAVNQFEELLNKGVIND